MTTLSYTKSCKPIANIDCQVPLPTFLGGHPNSRKKLKVGQNERLRLLEKLHESEKLEEFSSDEQGLLWLKVKSIVRKEFISEFVTENAIELKETSLKGIFVELYALLAKNPTKS